MSSLATLGTALQKQTGIPANAAAVPGSSPAPAKIAAVPSSPLSTLGTALGTPASTTTAAPIGGRVAGTAADPLPGTAAATVKNTAANMAQADTDGSNPQIASTLANGQLTTAQAQVTQGNKDTAQAATDTQTYTQAAAAATQQINSVSSYVQGGWLGLKAPSANSAPQLIIDSANFTTNDAGFLQGTVYQLQPDGSYKEIDFDGTKQSNAEWLQLSGIGGDPTKTASAIQVSNANAIEGVVNAYSAYGKAQVGLSNATALAQKGQQEIATGTSGVTSAQNSLNNLNSTAAQHASTAALGTQLASIGTGLGSAYGTDVNTAQQQQVDQMQAAGNSGIGSTGSALDAAAFGSANIAQTNAQGLATQKAGLVDQQGQQTASALQSALQTASQQSGLQLQTMDQDLTEAISSLQNDLQYATAEQQQAIQAYINQLQNQQSVLQNSVGQSGLDQSHITQIAQSVASGVASAGATYASSSTKKAS